jgi:hypothetical protein
MGPASAPLDPLELPLPEPLVDPLPEPLVEPLVEPLPELLDDPLVDPLPELLVDPLVDPLADPELLPPGPGPWPLLDPLPHAIAVDITRGRPRATRIRPKNIHTSVGCAPPLVLS